MKTKTRKPRRQLDLSPDQIEASKVRKETLRKLATSVREMTEEEQVAEVAKSGLIPSIAGRDLSPFNSIFLRRQMAGVQQVGGFQQWRKEKRKVKKGSKALAIWMPLKKKEDKKDAPDKEETDSLMFRIVNVFDISQTEEA
jgi:hypothetical protein